MADKICRECRHWHHRHGDAGICTLNPKVWAGSWEYPHQFGSDTCSHFATNVVVQPVVKGKAKSAA